MATASGINFAGGPAGGALLTGPPDAGAITNKPSALVFTAGDAEAGVEDDTPPALESADKALAFGSLQSLGGSFGTSDLAAGAETDAPPGLGSDDRGNSIR